MSLINKMLQDLDARANQIGPAPQAELHPVACRERGIAPRTVWIGVAAVLVLIGAMLGWRLLQRVPVLPTLPAIVAANVGVPVAAAATAPVVPVPALELTPAPAPASTQTVALVPAMPAASVPAPQRRVGPPGDTTKSAPHAHARRAQAKAAPAAPPAAPVEVKAPPAGQGRELSGQQRAENAYRRALLALQDGRPTEAITALQQALVIEPRHQASRETLIRLLLENKRQDEAMDQLELGLGHDPQQPALAMLLARLQVEQGGPAADTLMRTLPFAVGNSQYQAFLAAVLQREQRHKEAAGHYELALRGAPQNGVWWMGLGISLQAEQRLSEAKEAFARARASTNLTPELAVFVERKLQQLTR